MPLQVIKISNMYSISATEHTDFDSLGIRGYFQRVAPLSKGYFQVDIVNNGYADIYQTDELNFDHVIARPQYKELELHFTSGQNVIDIYFATLGINPMVSVMLDGYEMSFQELQIYPGRTMAVGQGQLVYPSHEEQRSILETIHHSLLKGFKENHL
jgi:hypothetical protein